MSSSQTALWVILLLFLPFFRVTVAGSPDLQYMLWLDEGTYAEQTVLESCNQGLSGADLYQIHVCPGNADVLVARGYSLGYISRDGGKTWQELSLPGGPLSYQRPFYFSPDGVSYVPWGSTLLLSEDQGKTWKEFYDSNNFDYGMLEDGSLWVERGMDRYYSLKVQGDALVVGEELETEPPLPASPQRNETVTLGKAKIEANLTTLPDGSQWAATARGSYHRERGAQVWKEATVGQTSPNALYLRQSPVRPEEVLMLDSGHRLWKSSDFGDSWFMETEAMVQAVRYNRQGESVVLYSDGKITEGGQELEVPREIRVEALDAFSREHDLEESLAEQAFLDAGRAPSGEFWILTGRFHRDRQNYNNPFRSVAKEWYMLGSDKLIVQTDGKWSVRQASDFATLHPPSEQPGLNTVSKERKIAFWGERIPYGFSFLGLPERAGWLQTGERYFLLGDEGMQIGAVLEDRLVFPATIWSWSYATDDEVDRGYLQSEESEILRTDSAVKLLIPGSTGVWTAQVPIQPPAHWRRLVYYLVFGVHLWILWGVLVIAFLLQWRRAVRA